MRVKALAQRPRAALLVTLAAILTTTPTHAQSAPNIQSIAQQAARQGPTAEGMETPDQADYLTRPLQPVTFLAPGTSPYQTAHLLGNWAGLLPILENNGIHPFVNYLSEAAGNPTGGKIQTGAYAQQITLAADLDWYQIAHIPGLQTHITVVNRQGNNLSSAMGNLFDVQEIWGGAGPVARLVYLTAEQNLFHGRLNIIAGRMLAGTDFAASDLYCNFQSLGLCPNPESLFLNSRTSGGGYQIFPYSAWGGRIRGYPTRQTYLQIGAFEEQNSSLIGASGWDWSLHQSTGVLIPIEAGFTPGIGKNGLPGHYKIGGMFDTATHPDMLNQVQSLTPGNLVTAPRLHRGQAQIYALADQMIHRFGPGDTTGLVLLGGFVWSSQATAEIDRFGFAGLSGIGMIPGRKMDQISLLALYGHVNSRLARTDALQKAAGNTSIPGIQSNEIDLEADYAATILPGTKLMPNIQYIIRPGAVSTYHNALVLGFRTSILF